MDSIDLRSRGRVRSVNVGRPRTVEWRGRLVSTGIFKEPVEGPVAVAGVNLDGDEQADLEVHGGRDKAVYVYPAEHYGYWERELGRALPWGVFGENLTVEGLPTEDEVSIGDRLRVGTATFLVTQPRLPCFKLGIRFDDAGMVRRFLEAGRTGYYLRIETEGQLEAGDDVEIVSRDAAAVPVSEVTRLATRDRRDAAGLRRVLAVDALPDAWRPYFEELLEEAV
jgi:MOSC domain-containing protein YiiM